MKPFIKPQPAAPAQPPRAPAPAPRISPNELTIFTVAVSMPDAVERAAYLSRACGTDAALRARLEERLATRNPPRPAASPAPAPVPAPAPFYPPIAVSPPPTTISPVPEPIAEPFSEPVPELVPAPAPESVPEPAPEFEPEPLPTAEPAPIPGPQSRSLPEAQSHPESAPSIPAEFLRMTDRNLPSLDRPDSIALVPMSALQFAASQQPPRHSPIPWAAATIMAVAVGALAVFLFNERNHRNSAERLAQAANTERGDALRERDLASASALEAKTAAERGELARKEAETQKVAATAEAAAARAEAARNRAEREQAQAALKAANDKTQAAQGDVEKSRAQSSTGQRATALALADSLTRLGSLQLDSRAYAEAESSIRQSLEIRVAGAADGWAILESRALLGAILVQKNLDAEALKEFEAAGTAIETLGAPKNDLDRARGVAATKRIVQFFNITGRRKDAADWRRRLEAVLAPR